MAAAGIAAFKAGRPCVPGLDEAWTLKLRTVSPGYASQLAAEWREGWLAEASAPSWSPSRPSRTARPERPYKRCPDVEFDGFTFFDCARAAGHDGECRRG